MPNLLFNHNYTFVLHNELCCNFNYFLWKSPASFYYIILYCYNSSFELLIPITVQWILSSKHTLCEIYLKIICFWILSQWWVFMGFFGLQKCGERLVHILCIFLLSKKAVDERSSHFNIGSYYSIVKEISGHLTVENVSLKIVP